MARCAVGATVVIENGLSLPTMLSVVCVAVPLPGVYTGVGMALNLAIAIGDVGRGFSASFRNASISRSYSPSHHFMFSGMVFMSNLPEVE